MAFDDSANTDGTSCDEELLCANRGVRVVQVDGQSRPWLTSCTYSHHFFQDPQYTNSTLQGVLNWADGRPGRVRMVTYDKAGKPLSQDSLVVYTSRGTIGSDGLSRAPSGEVLLNWSLGHPGRPARLAIWATFDDEHEQTPESAGDDEVRPRAIGSAEVVVLYEDNLADVIVAHDREDYEARARVGPAFSRIGVEATSYSLEIRGHLLGKLSGDTAVDVVVYDENDAVLEITRVDVQRKRSRTLFDVLLGIGDGTARRAVLSIDDHTARDANGDTVDGRWAALEVRDNEEATAELGFRFENLRAQYRVQSWDREHAEIKVQGIVRRVTAPKMPALMQIFVEMFDARGDYVAAGDATIDAPTARTKRPFIYNATIDVDPDVAIGHAQLDLSCEAESEPDSNAQDSNVATDATTTLLAELNVSLRHLGDAIIRLEERAADPRDAWLETGRDPSVDQ